MKRQIGILGLFVTIGIACNAPAESAKIAVVDMSAVIGVYHETKTAEDLIEQEVQDFEAEREEMLDKRDEMKEDFEAAREEADNDALSEKARDEKLEVAARKLTELRRYEKEILETDRQRKQQVADQRMRMRRRIVAKLRGIIQEYAEKNGYDLVLDTSGMSMNAVETVVYAPAKTDITEDILKLLEKKKEE